MRVENFTFQDRGQLSVNPMNRSEANVGILGRGTGKLQGKVPGEDSEAKGTDTLTLANGTEGIRPVEGQIPPPLQGLGEGT